ncbi:MAG: metal-dependent hydrolase [Halorubrum sp.]
MALLWLAPAWFLLDARNTAGTFVASGVLFGMLPDVDLVLEGVLPAVKHHGVFHTILLATLLAAVIGPLVGKVVEAVAGDTDWLSPEAAAHSIRFGFLAVWIPGLAHVFADMLSAPDLADSIEPLWPLYHGSIGVDLVWYNNPVVNWGLLAAGVLVNVGLYLYTGGRSPSD